MSEPIWRRVQVCAQELTRGGLTPFTRRDLIRRIQRTAPECGSDSINPIIQGLTDNLRGGAPGAVGKDLLHSVGRGLFILKGSATSRSGASASAIAPGASQKPGIVVSIQPVNRTQPTVANRDLDLNGYAFCLICTIDPERNEDGSIREFLPQDRYRNAAMVPLNNYGHGPFCKFKIRSDIARSGVYTFIAGNEVRYVGECENLSSRFNLGYGNISPRNCYLGGQETNCRINNLVLESIKGGLKISLWFHETKDYKLVESVFRSSQRFGWNRA